MSEARLVISGSIAIDRIMNFSGQYHDLIEPSKIKVLSVSVLVNSLTVSHGGTGANIAYNLALLGETPILLGAIGSDGHDYLEKLAAAGVDTTSVHRSQLPTASFSVLTDASNNQVGGFYPGAMGDADLLSLANWQTSQHPNIFCISAHDPDAMRRQISEAKQHKLRLFYDPGQQISNVSSEDIAAGIDAAEVVIVNDYEQEVLLTKTGMTIEQLRAKVPLLISTHGEDGSVLSGTSLTQAVSVASATPDTIADPTGAGDAYRAGFLYGYLRQWDVRICAQLGSVVASFVLEQFGTQGTLTKEAITDRYQKTYNEEITL